MLTAYTSTLALLTGCAALTIAVYLQLLGGDEAPPSYAVGYYLLGAGILFILAELEYQYEHGILLAGLLMILGAEYVIAWAIVRTYHVRTPQQVFSACKQEVCQHG